MKNEGIEAAFLSIDKDPVRARLKAAGFAARTFTGIHDAPQSISTYPTAAVAAAAGAPAQNKWARVRQEANKITMTVKDLRGTGINDTYETELTVNDFDTAVDFLKSCGLREKAFQESLRETWERGGIEVVIDTWPGLDPFIEIEGPNEAKRVRAAATELGFDFSQAVFGSVGVIYEKELGIPAAIINNLPEITFANPPRKSGAQARGA